MRRVSCSSFVERERERDRERERERERERDAPLDVVLLADNVLGDLEPQLLAQEVVVLGALGAQLGELDVVDLERQVDARLVHAHLRVDAHARLDAAVRPRDAQRIVEVVQRVACARVGRREVEEAQEGGLVRGRGRRRVQRHERVVHGRVGVVRCEDAVLEVADEVLGRLGRRGRGSDARRGEGGDEAADVELRLSEERVDGLPRRVADEDGGEAVVQVDRVLQGERESVSGRVGRAVRARDAPACSEPAAPWSSPRARCGAR